MPDVTSPEVVIDSTAFKVALRITPLGLDKGRLQQPIMPGRVGLLMVGGRIVDRNGRSQVFGPGERPAMVFMASRLYGIPGLGHVDQVVIEFAQNPGRVAVTFRQPLLGISRDEKDPAEVTVYADFRMTDPVKFITWSSDDWQNWTNLKELNDVNARIAQRVAATAKSAIAPKMQDLSATPTYLTADNLTLIQQDFRDLLDREFRDSGLQVVDGLPPVRKYPNALTRVLYEVRLGMVEFQLALKRQTLSRRLRMELDAEEAQKLAALGPTAGFLHIAKNKPELAVKMVEANGQRFAETAKTLRLLLAAPSSDAEISKQVLFTALQQSEQQFPELRATPPSAVGTPGLPILGMDPAAGIPGLESMAGIEPGGELRDLKVPVAGPTVVGAPGPAPVTAEATIGLEKLVKDEISRISGPDVWVEDLGTKNERETIEFTVDEEVTFRVRIGLAFLEEGPSVDYVIVRGKRRRPADQPNLLPPWPKGSHLEALVKLVRSGYFS
jgi:hypothetical protein